jgi:phage protein D
VLAEDRFQELRMERRTRAFENMSDSDVISQIASQHSLTPQLDIDGPTYPVLTQVNQSDLSFIRQRAAAVDAELWIDNKTLYVQARSRRSAGSVSFTYGQNLMEFTVLADLAHQRTSVTVNGWSVADKDVIEYAADSAAISSEASGGRGGSAVLAQALEEHKDRIVTALPVTKDEAQRIAEARYRERARGFVRGTGMVDGNVKLRVGATVDMSGLGPFFDGKYYVSLARHTFTLREGYRTTFEVERPFIGG